MGRILSTVYFARVPVSLIHLPSKSLDFRETITSFMMRLYSLFITVAGTGIVITCTSDKPETPNAGILQLDEGVYVDGNWKPGRRLNGDQDHQGRHIRIPVGEYGIQKLTLYRY